MPWTPEQDGHPAEVIFQADGFEWGKTPTVEEDEEADDCGRIIFQHGPRLEFGDNGTTIEIVIQALIERLDGFQRGPFPSDSNAYAINHLQLAKLSLEERTQDRQLRGVEGKDIP